MTGRQARDQTTRAFVETFDDDSNRGSLCVVDGYGVRVAVERGHLVVADGIAEHRRERRYPRATCRLERLVVIGHTGSVTLEALRWCADVGVAYVHLDAAGRLLATSVVAGSNDARLRRAQALAPARGVALPVARSLVATKLDGQARVADQLGAAPTAETIRTCMADLAVAPDVESVRATEGQAASHYWTEAWGPQPVRWVTRDRRRVPAHWRTFGGRSSMLRSEAGPRRATTPANAMLNYLYALAEAECTLALATVGLDPGFGWLHFDQRARDSAALDVLEAVRPDVDAYVVDRLAEPWSARDFAEGRDGTVRILAPLTHQLAPTLSEWRARAGPVVETVAQTLADDAALGRLSTPVTQANRSAGRDAIRRHTRRPVRQAVAPARHCETCGAELVDRRRRWCPSCAASRRGEIVAGAAKASVAARREARAAGTDAAQSPGARAKITRTKRKRDAERRRWEAEHPDLPDTRVFTTSILPTIRDVPLGMLAEATGLTRAYLSRVRRGLQVPHPMHWEAIAELAGAGMDSDNADLLKSVLTTS
jgi:CRISPR-associated endonuclease Cas1